MAPFCQAHVGLNEPQILHFQKVFVLPAREGIRAVADLDVAVVIDV